MVSERIGMPRNKRKKRKHFQDIQCASSSDSHLQRKHERIWVLLILLLLDVQQQQQQPPAYVCDDGWPPPLQRSGR